MTAVGTHPIYTIGYGARSLETFLDVLVQHGIAYLVDVRSSPYSRFKPEFSRTALEASLRLAHIHYVYLGAALGGQPKDRDCYEADKVIYDRVREKAFYKAGLDRIKRAFDQGLCVALMCSEGKPELCHRSALIGVSLAELGLPVLHIDEHDVLLSQADVVGRRTGGQLLLLGEPEFHSRKRYKPKAFEAELENDE